MHFCITSIEFWRSFIESRIISINNSSSKLLSLALLISLHHHSSNESNESSDIETVYFGWYVLRSEWSAALNRLINSLLLFCNCKMRSNGKGYRHRNYSEIMNSYRAANKYFTVVNNPFVLNFVFKNSVWYLLE